MDVVFKKCATLLFLVLFLSGGGTISSCHANKSSHSILCIESEKRALLSFKQGLRNDTNNDLSSWTAEQDCCKWTGVACNSITGHVQELRLDALNGVYGPLVGKVSPSLLNLTHMTHLVLTSFDSEGAQIPEFVGSLAALRYLDLKGAKFGGQIPQQLGNLSSLRYLSLGCESLDCQFKLYSDNLQWLSGLSSLESIDLSFVNLSKASDHWLLAINKLPSLLEIHLHSCELSHIHHLSYINFTSIAILDISSNNFNSPIPDWIFSLNNLVNLGLHNSNFLGPFPNGSWSLNSLTDLDVSENYLSSTIPSFLYGLPNLEYLNLLGNNLQGVVSSAIGNLTSLADLALSYNALEGELPMSFGNLHNLVSLNLGRNSFSCSIPVSFGKLSALEYLDISQNQLNGSLPESFGSLSNLMNLDISKNHLEGLVSEVHLGNLTNLNSIYASGNSLSLRVHPDWIPPFNLTVLELSSWNLGSKFPMWLKSQKKYLNLDLSNTGISDVIPSWFWISSTNVQSINLSHNQLYGNIPDMHDVGSFSMIYLSSNKFKGPLPRISSTVLELDLSNNSFHGDISHFLCHPTEESGLNILHLGQNLLSGNIPDCWTYWPSLRVINLCNNNLTGEIPSSLGSLRNLQSLHLRNNSLSGELPLSLQNCTRIKVVDLSLNKFAGRIPRWGGANLSNLMALNLHGNKLSGDIPLEICSLEKLQILDVAHNNLSGGIPSCFNNFTAMVTKPASGRPIFHSLSGFEFLENAFVVTRGREDQYDTILSLVASLDLSNNNLSGQFPEELTSLQGLLSLNLSRNHLRGNIPENIGNLTWVLSLDISRNQLSGKIPPSMSNLNFLSYLDVSYNNLSGEIPLSTQLQSLNPSSFIGNKLCGPPLSNDCGEGNKKAPPGIEDGGQNKGDGDEEEYWFRLGIVVGFAVGFLGVISLLVFYGFYRRAYYWFFQEYLWYKIFDCCIKLKRMMRN